MTFLRLGLLVVLLQPQPQSFLPVILLLDIFYEFSRIAFNLWGFSGSRMMRDPSKYISFATACKLGRTD